MAIPQCPEPGMRYFHGIHVVLGSLLGTSARNVMPFMQPFEALSGPANTPITDVSEGL
jgi:hypothetical protein